MEKLQDSFFTFFRGLQKKHLFLQGWGENADAAERIEIFLDSMTRRSAIFHNVGINFLFPFESFPFRVKTTQISAPDTKDSNRPSISFSQVDHKVVFFMTDFF
jgi:hypothetical protein